MKILLLNNLHKNTGNKLFIIAFFLVLLLSYWIFKPSSNILFNRDFSQVVYSRNKDVLRITLSKDDKYRVYTHINSSGPLIKEAVLLKEDQYFYYHPGVNPVSVGRAINETYLKKSARVGGSTITMQVVRLYYGLKTKTILGKLKQIFYALYLELYYSKEEILEAYLNLAPCGGNIEGFAAASLIYFEKELSEITLQEALFLSILPQNPSAYSPKSHHIPIELTAARLRLFKLWQKKHSDKINSEQIAHSKMPLSISYSIPYDAPHFTTSILQKHTREHRIYTTLDSKSQALVTRLTQQYVQRKKTLGVENAAVLLVDYKNNMEVTASLGSVDFFNEKIQGQVDGTNARRSPGSTLKPFIYALAMDQGIIHPMTMLKDAPTSFAGYTPDNYERDFKGPIKAWEALINSRNVPAVWLASKIQNPDLYDLLKSLNLGDLKPKKHYGLSIALGSAEFSMTELVSLYGILANNGVFQRVNDNYTSGSFINQPYQKHYLTQEACWITKNILQKNPKPNFNNLLAYGNKYNRQEELGAIGYKTGTSIGFKDCWSIAIFDKYVLAVWLGNFDGYGNPAFNGRKLATPLLFDIASNIMAEDANAPGYEKCEEMLSLPPGVKEVEVCALSGQLANSSCKQKLQTHFIPGKSSIKKCEICREILVNTKTGYRVHNKGKNVKSEVYEFWSTDLLRIFRNAGVPRKTPPIFDPNEKNINNQFADNKTGFAPKIISPMPDTEYFITTSESAFNNLPLKAVVDADVEEIYWFIDEQFIGRSNPEVVQYWSLRPGKFQIGVVDDKGRSNSMTLKIGLVTN